MPFIDMTKESESRAIVIDYLKSIFRGVGGGLYDASIGLAHTLMHPYDNLYVPIKDVLYNAIILGAGIHGDNPMFMDGEFAILHRQIQNNPKLYYDALTNVQENALQLEEAIQTASGSQRTEMAVRMAVGIFAPGYFLKIARVFANNLEQFGTIRTPLRFPNLATHETTPGSFEAVSVQSIKQERLTGKFLWILTENNNLVISRHWGWQMGAEFPMDYYHSSLAGLKPVIGAGELKTFAGTIKFIDNNSGHYRPFGPQLKPVIETVFIRNGFPEALGKFINRTYGSRLADLPTDYTRPNPFRPSQGYGRPAVEGVGTGASAQLSGHADADAHADAESAYTSILPSRASLGILDRPEKQPLYSVSASPSSPVVTRPLEQASVYTPILPPRPQSGTDIRASQSHIVPPIFSSSSSSFSPTIDSAESIMRPLVESLMPAPNMDSSQFGRSDMTPQVFRSNPMQTLATSLTSQPPIDLTQTIQSHMTPPINAPQMPIPHVPTLVESLMPAPSMQALATSWTFRPPIDFAQRIQTNIPPAMSASSSSAFHVPTAATHLGFAPNPNPMQSVMQSLEQSRVNPLQSLQDRMQNKR